LPRNAFQQAAATGRQIVTACFAKIAQKKGNVFVPGYCPESRKVYPALPVGVPGMPSGELHIIVTGIVAVPSKNHVAKAIAVLQAVDKFFMVYYLSPQNTVNIGKSEFYFLYVVFLQVGYNLIFIHDVLNKLPAAS
jgi:hypothetical protein